MNEFVIFKGENKGFKLTLTTNGEDVSNVAVAVVDEMKRRVITYQTADNTLVLDGDVYVCELTSEQSKDLRPTTYAIEGYVVTASGTTIKPLGEIKVLTDKMFNL